MSRVIRADEVAGNAGLFNLADFEREARDVVARAQARAEQILADARSQAEGLSAEARKQGLEAGRAEGLEAGEQAGRKAGREEGLAGCRQDTSTLAEMLGNLTTEFGARRESLIKEAERDMLELSTRIAERVVRRELHLDEGAAARAAAEAIALAATRSELEMRVNPADEVALGEAHADLKRQFADLEDISLIADQAVERGGCVISTAEGSVDMQVGTQLDRISELLIGAGSANVDSGGQREGEGGQ